MKTFTIVILTFCSITRVASETSAAVEVSFLRDPAVLEETVALLKDAGCVNASTHRFERAVLQHNAAGLGMDTGHLPPRQDGFYLFDAFNDFAECLPHRLWEAQHRPGIVCFDTAIGLLMDQGLSSELESVKAENEQFLVLARREGRGAYIVRQVSTFEEAFRMLRHEPYLYYLREQLGLTPSREYQAISMSLAQCQAIPWGVNLPLEAIFGLRLNQWRREGLSFSEGLELVQFHRVNRREQLVMTTHVGVLMQRNDGRITYIEKVGPTGPFVRVDMDCRAEILERAGLLDVPGGPYEYFVSINDAFLGESWPKSLLPHRVIEGHGYYRHASMNCWTNAISLNTSRLAGTDRLRHNGR